MGMEAKDINLGKLIRYTEDDLNVVECFDEDNPNCNIISRCMLAGILQMALNSFFEVLDGHTLEDLTGDLCFPDFIQL